jgi:hypothetical protein
LLKPSYNPSESPIINSLEIFMYSELDACRDKDALQGKHHLVEVLEEVFSIAILRKIIKETSIKTL